MSKGWIPPTGKGATVRHGDMRYRLTLSTRNERAIHFGEGSTEMFIHRKQYQTGMLLVREAEPGVWRWVTHVAYVFPALTSAAQRDLRTYLEALAPLVAARHEADFAPLTRDLAGLQVDRAQKVLDELEREMDRVKRFERLVDIVAHANWRYAIRDVEQRQVRWGAPRSLGLAESGLREVTTVYAEVVTVDHPQRVVGLGVDNSRFGSVTGGGLLWVPIEETSEAEGCS